MLILFSEALVRRRVLLYALVFLCFREFGFVESGQRILKKVSNKRLYGGFRFGNLTVPGADGQVVAGKEEFGDVVIASGLLCLHEPIVYAIFYRLHYSTIYEQNSNPQRSSDHQQQHKTYRPITTCKRPIESFARSFVLLLRLGVPHLKIDQKLV